MKLPVDSVPILATRATEQTVPTKISTGFIAKKRMARVLNAVPGTVITVAVASIAVGAAATILSRQSDGSVAHKILYKTCEECTGSGLCSECKGEGFVPKPLSEGSERAKLSSTSMATRYTAALPKKWTYCSKCTSSRSCKTCDGSGRLPC